MLNYEEHPAQSQPYGAKLLELVEPLLVRMNEYLNKRRVRTFLKTLEAVIAFRHSAYGLLPSELRRYIP